MNDLATSFEIQSQCIFISLLMLVKRSGWRRTTWNIPAVKNVSVWVSYDTFYLGALGHVIDCILCPLRVPMRKP